MPQIKIIIVTSLAECSFIERAHKAGVESFWYKDAGKEELLEVMDRTMKGGECLSGRSADGDDRNGEKL